VAALTFDRSKIFAGLVVAAMVAVILSLTSITHAQTSSCTTYYTSSVAVPTGYGAAYNLFTVSHEPLISIDCSGSTPKLTVGSNLSNQYSYNLGYIYQNGSWQQLPLTGSNLANNAWYPGLATGPLPAASSNWTYVVGYVGGRHHR
jgi:hypothetical protein